MIGYRTLFWIIVYVNIWHVSLFSQTVYPSELAVSPSMDVFVKAILRKTRRSSSLATAQYSGLLFTIQKYDHSLPPPSPGDVYSLWAVRMPFTKILAGHFSESPLDLDPGTFHPLIPTCLPAVYLHCPCECRTDLRVSPHHRILFAVVLMQVVLGLSKWAFSFFKESYMNVQLYFPTFVFRLWILHTFFVMTNLTGRQTDESTIT